MKFEDLFKTKEPTNYVEQASGGQDPLMKFFAERTVKAQKAKQPITPEKEAIIKKEFALPTAQAPAPVEEPMMEEDLEFSQLEKPSSMQPQMPSTPETSMQEETTTYEPSNFIANLAPNKEETLSERAEKLLPERGIADYLPYLVPFLVKGLAGTNVNAAEIAGSALMGSEADRIKRKQTLEDKLLEMDKSKLTKKLSLNKMQLKPLRDKMTGESLMGNYDPATGMMYVQGQAVNTSQYELAPGLSTQEYTKRQGVLQQKQMQIGDYFGRGVRLDPDTGLLARVINGKLVPIQVQRGQLNPQQTRNLERIVNSYKSSDVYKKNADTLKFSRTIQDLLADGNPIAIEMARSELAKAAEGGGRLSDADIERLGGSKAIRERIDRFTYLQSTGEPATPKDVVFMQRVADILESKARKSLTQSIIGLEEDFIQKGGIPGAVQTSLNPYAPQLAEKPSAESGISGMVKVQDKKTRKVGYIPRKNLNKEALKKYRIVR